MGTTQVPHVCLHIGNARHLTFTRSTSWVGAVSNGVDRGKSKKEPASGGADTDTDLETVLRNAGRLSPRDALRYLTPLISVLEGLHTSGRSHGSLSLDLLRVTKGDDGAPRLRLLKGRTRKLTLQDASPKAALAGRMLLYSSPEQIQGAEACEFDDMYALGHMAYTLLVGEPYWIEEVDRLGFMALCNAIIGGVPEAPSVRAMRRKSIRLPHDFDAWFVLITTRKHPDHFRDITDAGIALTSVLSNPDIRELSRSVQFKFNPNILESPSSAVPAPPENLRFTAVFTIVASISLAIAIVMLLRWTNAQESPKRDPSLQSTDGAPATSNPSSP